MPRRKENKKKGKLDKWLLLSWKKFLLIVVLWIVFVVLHNLVSALLGIEEALFFILAVIVLPAYVLVMIVYSLVRKLKK